MLKIRCLTLSSCLLLVLSAACYAESEPGSSDAHRSGVQLMSTTVDLASHDLCWTTDDGQVRVDLDATMLDSAATGYLPLPLGVDVHATLVRPGQACDAESALDLDTSVLADETFAVLTIDVDAHGELDGSFAELRDEDDTALRMGGCNPGATSLHTETITGSNGSCSTRSRLYECKTVYLFHGEYANVMSETYDSGWLDCSDPCLTEA